VVVHGEIVESLIGRYQTLVEAPPEWAYRLSPSIPFVGEEYFNSSRKLAVYASAENLSHYERGKTPIPDYHHDERVWNRHRAARDSSDNRFFPFVHIAPVEKGGLLVAALFVTQLLGEEPDTASPSELLESLVVANVGKFSIRTGGKANRDYASNMTYLQDSLPLFETDLECLMPDILVIPKTIFRHSQVQRIVRRAAPNVMVIPVPQFIPQVLNMHLQPREGRAVCLRQELRGSKIEAWIGSLKGVKREYVYRYLAELERIIEGIGSQPDRTVPQ
jgi:hypothetical protein